MKNLNLHQLSKHQQAAAATHSLLGTADSVDIDGTAANLFTFETMEAEVATLRDLPLL